jgi:hypothetical protein
MLRGTQVCAQGSRTGSPRRQTLRTQADLLAMNLTCKRSAQPRLLLVCTLSDRVSDRVNRHCTPYPDRGTLVLQPLFAATDIDASRNHQVVRAYALSLMSRRHMTQCLTRRSCTRSGFTGKIYSGASSSDVLQHVQPGCHRWLPVGALPNSLRGGSTLPDVPLAVCYVH